MKNRRFLNHNAGFTLIELAIVLVVISLLIVSVVGAQRLIDSARANRIVTEMNSIKTDTALFQAAFNGTLPADMDEASASALVLFGGTSVAEFLALPTDGKISEFDDATTPLLATHKVEMRNYFRFLHRYLNEGGTSYSPTPLTGNTIGLPQSEVDARGSKAYGGSSYMIFALGSTSGSPVADTEAGTALNSILPNGTNIIALATAPALTSTAAATGTDDYVANTWKGAVPMKIARLVDIRIDGENGAPVSGSLLTVSPGITQTTANCGGLNTTALPDIIEATSTTAYSSIYTSDTADAKNCIVISRL